MHHSTLAVHMRGLLALENTYALILSLQLDCKMLFDSSDVRFVVVGRGPLGAFTARVSAVQMTGQRL